MDTGFVTSEQIALILSCDECTDPNELVCRCLAEHGLKTWGQTNIKLFIRGRHSLLLAQPSPPRRRRICSGEPRIRRRS